MARLTGLLAVQVSSAHHRMPNRGGAWGIAILTLGLALVCYGAVPMVRLRLSDGRWVLSWSLILGIGVVGAFAAVVST